MTRLSYEKQSWRDKKVCYHVIQELCLFSSSGLAKKEMNTYTSRKSRGKWRERNSIIYLESEVCTSLKTTHSLQLAWDILQAPSSWTDICLLICWFWFPPVRDKHLKSEVPGHPNYHYSTFWEQEENNFLLMEHRCIKTKPQHAVHSGRLPGNLHNPPQLAALLGSLLTVSFVPGLSQPSHEAYLWGHICN